MAVLLRKFRLLRKLNNSVSVKDIFNSLRLRPLPLLITNVYLRH